MANVGDSPTLMLNAPVPAARKVLEKAGLTVDDIDLWEINEAFAVVAEKFIRDLKLDREKVNVNGGAMALGHPIGATGSILIGTMLDELERRDLKRGLVTMCAAGGMAPGDHHRAGLRRDNNPDRPRERWDDNLGTRRKRSAENIRQFDEREDFKHVAAGTEAILVI